jgi:8-oxo-dGTP diphosphatase
VGAYPSGARRVSQAVPRVGCGAAIVRDGRILLVKRLKAPEAGCWNLPGGRVDFLERIEDAIVRETGEEIGVAIELAGMLCMTQMIGIDGQHWVSPVFLARLIRGEPENREPLKHSELDWFAFDSLPEPLALAAHEAIEALNANRNLPREF